MHLRIVCVDTYIGRFLNQVRKAYKWSHERYLKSCNDDITRGGEGRVRITICSLRKSGGDTRGICDRCTVHLCQPQLL